MTVQTHNPKPLIHRLTGLGVAIVAAAEAAGIDTSSARLPRITEPAWTVTRRRNHSRRGRK